ncbi:cyclopropane-fatty-acyl-phospholipid synthase [Tistrella bauzanensis]|uniref:cyclopropane-fatty-acyl-phospholipid synthase family protein n=1 Tax=Tistrella TaxID=171436 RepID=UPI0031F71966
MSTDSLSRGGPGAGLAGIDLPALLRGAVERWAVGDLTIILPDGRRVVARGATPGPHALMRLADWSVVRRCLKRGAVGFAEAYIDGAVDTDDLPALLTLLARNEAALAAGFAGRRTARILGWMAHALVRRNSRRGSKRNIHAHYDLGNSFYELWLDPSMSYSAGIFGPDGPGSDGPGSDDTASDDTGDLIAAQHAKYDRILDRIAGDGSKAAHILEIGCGWGGFAERAAERGHTVHGITISRAQLAYAKARARAGGWDDRAVLDFRDYRDLQGRFDHIVSIEMIEAVGERWWPAYFRTLADRLAPGGRAIVQAITIHDAHFDRYRRGADFIQRYVFPGGMLPTRQIIRDQAAAAGLAVTDEYAFGADYARTLIAWLARFDAARARVVAAGFDDRFIRLWRYYLAYCAAGFDTGRIDVVQVEMAHAR